MSDDSGYRDRDTTRDLNINEVIIVANILEKRAEDLAASVDAFASDVRRVQTIVRSVRL